MDSDLNQLRQILAQSPSQLSRPLSQSEIDLLCHHYQLLLKWNPLLHLTTITSPAEFATRHILESLLAEDILLPELSEIWDIGSGAGFPGIPIAIRRPHLSVRLIESNKRKAIFLSEAAHALGLTRIEVVNRRFEALTSPPPGSCLLARAVERMDRLAPELLARATTASQILLYGNSELLSNLTPAIEGQWSVREILLPDSMDRRLFDIRSLVRT